LTAKWKVWKGLNLDWKVWKALNKDWKILKGFSEDWKKNQEIGSSPLNTILPLNPKTHFPTTLHSIPPHQNQLNLRYVTCIDESL
jgi:hypothetical protein